MCGVHLPVTPMAMSFLLSSYPVQNLATHASYVRHLAFMPLADGLVRSLSFHSGSVNRVCTATVISFTRWTIGWVVSRSDA